MVDEGESVFTWVEEIEGQPYAPVRQKRKYTHKKMEYVGWGSRLLIEFLMSLDKDVSEQISQHDASDIINKYVQDKNLLHPSKKKKIICDDRLHSLFGKKMINRIKIFDLLEVHYAENQDSDDEFLYSSDDNEKNTPEMYRQEKSEKKSNVKKKVRETPKSNFAAIIPKNIKLLYLKRTLVQDLSKDHESFENKIVRSFVRIKSDPNDYLQKNSHLLVQVTGVKKGTGCSDGNAELLLQVSYAIGEIQICKLSEDNFSEEECEDLRQRVKDGLLKRMTVGELEQKAQILHEDITKHWLVRELALLQSLIDRANEKGWRKEMFEHLERRDLLQTPSKQAELLRDVPEVVPDELETEAIAQESLNDESEDWPESITLISNNTCRSNLVVTPVLSTSAAVGSATVDSQSSARTNIAELAALPSDMPHITEKCNIASPKSIPHMEISGVDRAEVKTNKTKFSGSAVYETTPYKCSVSLQRPNRNEPLMPAVYQDNGGLRRPNLNDPLMPVVNQNNGGLQHQNLNDTLMPTANQHNGGLQHQNLNDTLMPTANEHNRGLQRPNHPPMPGVHKENGGLQCPNLNDPPMPAVHQENGGLQRPNLNDPPLPAIHQENRGLQCPNLNDLPMRAVNQARGLQRPDVNEPPVVIELSDDDEDEGFLDVHNVPAVGEGPLAVGGVPSDPRSPTWQYLDPRGNIQGPFTIASLKEWFDSGYFPPDFKIWKVGQSQEEAVNIIDVLRQVVPNWYR